MQQTPHPKTSVILSGAKDPTRSELTLIPRSHEHRVIDVT
jgi:hypothetical protein